MIVYPRISFAQIPILIFKEETKLLQFGALDSNLILFRSYHSDHITRPEIRPHGFRSFRFFKNPNHWVQKFVHRLCRTPEIPHYSNIIIHAFQANLHVKRICEFDSMCIPQNGQTASWVAIIPFSTRWSPVFSFSRFANHTHSFALRGIDFCHTRLTMGLGRVGV